MKVTTFEGIIENGQVRLPDNVRLPEKAKVYVVVPDVDMQSVAYVGSPRLAHPQQAEDFKKEVVEGINDELRPEYDLKSLRVRRLGPGRKSFGGAVIRLEPDVAEVFPDAESVNEALRFLIRIAKENKPPLRDISGDA